MLSLHIIILCLIVRRSSQAIPVNPGPGPGPGPIHTPPPRTTLAPATADTTCPYKADTIFLLDSSGSITDKYFKQKMLQSADHISRGLRPIGPRDNQVGVEVYSTYASTAIRLKDYSSYTALRSAIYRIKYIGDLTFTHKGLNRMCNKGFSSSYGGRRGVPNIGIVMTDGRSTNRPATIREAKKCRRKGIRLIAIPIGPSIDMEEIIAITNAKSAVLPAKDFDELVKPGFLQTLLGLRCKVLGSPAPPA